MKRGIAIAFGLLFASAGLVASEQADTLSHAGCAAPGDPVDPALLERPTVLRKDVGAVHQKVTTSSSEAQAFYDQGLTFLHHYVFIEAARSFHQALRSDPECAMCWMGLARAEQGLERREATAAAIEKAQALAAKASRKEQTFIALRAQQIEAQAAPSSEEKEKHAAYKAALDKALASYPDDAELWIIRGNAEEPGPWGRGQFGGSASIAFYETALVRSPGHLGADHYLVHSFENIAHHAEAAEHGKIYAATSPGVAHAQHMYGHVLPRLGRGPLSPRPHGFGRAARRPDDARDGRRGQDEGDRPRLRSGGAQRVAPGGALKGRARRPVKRGPAAPRQCAAPRRRS